eukprot:9497658-Pyramimonas_sp.AAC.1
MPPPLTSLAHLPPRAHARVDDVCVQDVLARDAVVRRHLDGDLGLVAQRQLGAAGHPLGRVDRGVVRVEPPLVPPFAPEEPGAEQLWL